MTTSRTPLENFKAHTSNKCNKRSDSFFRSKTAGQIFVEFLGDENYRRSYVKTWGVYGDKETAKQVAYAVINFHRKEVYQSLRQAPAHKPAMQELADVANQMMESIKRPERFISLSVDERVRHLLTDSRIQSLLKKASAETSEAEAVDRLIQVIKRWQRDFES